MLPSPAVASPSGADPRTETLARLRAQLGSTAVTPAAPPVLPVHAALADLLPGGGLRPGSAYSVTSGGLLLLSLLAGASQSGAWCAAVGMPELGAEAAAEAGVELSRLVLVPDPRDRWLAVTAAVADVMQLVAVRPSARVRDRDATRLAARLRERGAVLLVAGEWPQAEAVLSLSEPRWSGIDGGYGYLDHRDVVVTATSRRSPAPRRARIALPDPSGGIAVARSDAPTGLRAVG